MYTNIQQDQKAKMDYHMSMLFAYMAGGEGWRLEVLKCFVRGGQNFFYLLCVCGGGVQVQYLSVREKNNRPPPPINKRLVPITKRPKGHYVAYLF